MRRDRAEQRAKDLNLSNSGGGTHFAFHAGRNRWQVRISLPGGKSELIEQ